MSAAALAGVALAAPASAAPFAPTAPSDPPSGSGTEALTTGQSLTAGQYLESYGEGYVLVVQSDGNLVEYLATAGRAVWSTGTYGTTDPELVMQADGNLVLYATRGDTRAAVWNSGSQAPEEGGNDTPTGVLLSDNGALDLFSDGQFYTGTQPHDPTFDEYTSAIGRIESPDGSHVAVMQSDGNFVVYSTEDDTTRATWSSGTFGHPTSYLLLQSDGNVVSYGPLRPNGPVGVVFTTLTQGADVGSTDIVMQDDGNLVIYRYTADSRTAVWNTGTSGT